MAYYLKINEKIYEILKRFLTLGFKTIKGLKA